MPSANNIIVGGAKVYTKASVATGEGFIGGAAFDGLAANLSATTLAGIGTEIGFTSNGIDLSIEPEYQDVQVDQILDAAILFKTSQKVSFGTTLAEATLANLARAVGQLSTDAVATGTWTVTGSTVDLDIKGGSLGSFPSEIGIVAVANAPRSSVGSTERIFEAFRAISVEAVSIPVKRNETTQYPVSFRCLPQTDSTAAYLKIADRVYG